MARTRVLDEMQSHYFWLADVTPSPVPPFFSLDPLMAFQACSAPEISIEFESMKPANAMFPHHHVASASVAPITLRRGSTLQTSDFHRWVEKTIRGTDVFRRDLLLVHFLGLGSKGNGGTLPFSVPFTDVQRVPGRAWLLKECVPVRYSAGEFDATSAEVVMQELEVQPHYIIQIDLG